MVIQTKTNIFYVASLPKSICDKLKSKKALISPQNRFLYLETTFRYTFPASSTGFSYFILLSAKNDWETGSEQKGASGSW